jgi:signal transduction histidine kinase/ligand-binding sensor domain-containing protein/DNA-binding response OmpR family regulator
MEAQAQWRFRHLDKSDGLSQSSVFAIAQDDEGFLWFGTRNGLNRYDGYRFRVFQQQPDDPFSLVNNDVRAIYFDGRTRSLWLGTNGGLSRLDLNTEQFHNYRPSSDQANGLDADVVRSITRDPQGQLWIGTALGLLRYLPTTDSFAWEKTFLHGTDTLQAPDVKAILPGPEGELWVGTDQGLFCRESSAHGTYQFRRSDEVHLDLDPLAALHIKTLLRDPQGRYWIGTHDDGIFCWDRQSGKLRSYQAQEGDPFALSHNNIRSTTLDQNGRLWVGTFVGLNRYLPEQDGFKTMISEAGHPEGLSSSSIRALFGDQQGGVWIGTYYGGINYLDESFTRFQIYRPQLGLNSLSANVVSSFAEDAAGNLWIGTEGGGLNYFNPQSGRFQHLPAQPQNPRGLSGENIKTLLADGEQLWIGTFQRGLNRFFPGENRFERYLHDPDDPHSLSHDNVYSLLREGDSLWVATYGGGLNEFDIASGRARHFRFVSQDSTSLPSDQLRVLSRDQRGQIWIGSEKGLARLDRQGDRVQFQRFFPDLQVYALQPGEKNCLWIGTLGQGLWQFDSTQDTARHYTTADGLPGNTIFGILQDEAGDLWLSTDQGIAKLNRDRGTFTRYHHTEGLENLEFNYNAYYKTREGAFLFGGTHGFTRFFPAQIQPNTYVPPVVFSGLEAFNRRIAVGGEDQLLTQTLNHTPALTFAYNEANFTLRFAALDFAHPKSNAYSYRLEGIDPDWKFTTGEPKATYTLQREGTYTFYLRGGNNDGLWNPAVRTLTIRVLPPPWRSWWAYLAYVLLLVGVIWAVARYVRLQHSYQLEHLAKEKQEDLHQMKLRFFTNITHEFRTPLTLILGPLRELIQREEGSARTVQRLRSIEHNAQRLLALVNQLLDFRKLEAEHQDLEIAEGNVVRFLREIFLSFQETARLRGLNYRFEAEEAEIRLWYDRDKLEKVIYNLLSNAFKFTPDGGRIRLRVAAADAGVVIAVADNGRGMSPEIQAQIFQRFFEQRGGNEQVGSGIGLALSEQLVRLHGGRIGVASEPGEGTTFQVWLPQGHAHLPPEAILADFRDSEDHRHYQPLPSAPLAAKVAPPEDAPLLLLVEDNPEVQAYIGSVFGGEYRLLTAADGQQGLDMARERLPDLIISDVMMPRMDGTTLCRHLKTNLETSHIPVILLTARTALIFRLEGLETGADDYVNKPFYPEELRLKVRNAIEARQRLREKFARTRNFDPKEITVTSADEHFLEKVMQLAETHIDNPDFTIEHFAEELAVSRPLLFKKMKALTNQTPKSFLKQVRLKRAAQLLSQQKLNVAEVAYLTGFRDPKYFSKCFQQEYGETPSSYAGKGS